MEEKKKNIRLKKAATEFNVGLNTVVEFLAKKGHNIELNPNTRITAEQYELLATAFKSERDVKENADKIELNTNSNVTIEAPSVGTDNEEADENEELTIKNYANVTLRIASSDADTDSTATESAPAADSAQPMSKEAEVMAGKEVADAASRHDEEEHQKADVDETPKTEDSESGHETQVIEASVPSAEEGYDAYNAKVKVVDKIDLNALNSRTRPEKKKVERKEDKKKGDKKKDASSGKEARHDQQGAHALPRQTDETVQPRTVAAPAENNTAAAIAAAKQPATAAIEPAALLRKVESTVEFIETKYKKLEGPKVVSKIDLSQFEAPKNERRKRKRIKKNEGVKVSPEEIAGKNNNGSGNANGGRNGNKNGGKGSNSNNAKNGVGNDKKSDRNAKRKDKNKKGEEKKPAEVDDVEIEKQIRETLARLSPTGKSKTSKHNREKRHKVQMEKEQQMEEKMEQKNTLQVTEFVTANELATMMNVPVTKIISTCMSVGIFVSINQRLDAETIQLIADEFGYKVNFVSTDVVDTLNAIEEEDKPEDLVPRSPIITVMGHVDHGKTSLLDYIRNTNVIAGEAGGITQHIGAYEVTMPDGRKITFLDTPGHEAFTAMRARGAKVTDIAIIVIAADDKIMPQTIEAINHAQAAGVPIIFAVNKIDKPGADPDRIKTELANMNMLVEDWGGKYVSQDISAKKGVNVDLLLEKVLLQADIMELKGNPSKRAKGTVLESSLDKGRGYVAKLLVEDGSIRQGDPVLAGSVFGKVKAMYNERNQLVKEAGPSQPVLLLGLQGAPQAGDTFNVMENEKEAKDLAAKRQQLQREQGLRTQKHITLDEIGRRIAIGDFKELNLIVKADVDGTVEALSDSLLKLSNEEVQVNVVHKAVGQITESDVLLAEASNAVIIGFQVRPSVQARKMAETEQIDIRLYSIIYDAINELKDAIEGMLAPETQTKIVANLEIREAFKISKVGTIAGCMCLDGKIGRGATVRLIRDGIVVYTGKLASLKRFKDDVKEVFSGQDCGLSIENYNDIKVGDIVEAYETIEIKKKL